MKDDLLNDLDLLVARIKHEMHGSKKVVTEAGDPNDDRDIGTKLQIVLTTFNSNEPVDAKVDTGAEMSSIRVNNLKINEQQGVCSFNFYNKNVTMGYDGFQAVRLGDKTENRPLVSFNVVVPTKDANAKDITVNNVKFNLNEVQGQEIVQGDDYMDILLGMNFINAGKFRVVGRAQQMEAYGSDIDQDLRSKMNVNGMKSIATQMVHWASQEEDEDRALKVLMDELHRLLKDKESVR